MEKTKLCRSLFLLMFLILGYSAVAQKATDANYLFKMWLFVEHVNQDFRLDSSFRVKDSSLFNLYSSSMSLNLDTLKYKGFDSKMLFVRIRLTEQNVRGQKKPIQFDKSPHLGYLSVPLDNCNGYVLAVNNATGKTYRLAGFHGNDFMNLLSDIFQMKSESNSTKRFVNRFLKDYSVESLDFECLYKACTSNFYDIKKYPCLNRCSHLIVKIH